MLPECSGLPDRADQVCAPRELTLCQEAEESGDPNAWKTPLEQKAPGPAKQGDLGGFSEEVTLECRGEVGQEGLRREGKKALQQRDSVSKGPEAGRCAAQATGA